MLSFRQVILEIFLQLTMQNRWVLPIGKLICASNENKVLFDFFQTGNYDREP